MNVIKISKITILLFKGEYFDFVTWFTYKEQVKCYIIKFYRTINRNKLEISFDLT